MYYKSNVSFISTLLLVVSLLLPFERWHAMLSHSKSVTKIIRFGFKYFILNKPQYYGFTCISQLFHIDRKTLGDWSIHRWIQTELSDLSAHKVPCVRRWCPHQVWQRWRASPWDYMVQKWPTNQQLPQIFSQRELSWNTCTVSTCIMCLYFKLDFKVVWIVMQVL